jgi:membrane-associated PAP2 superfamily phosphatase
MRAKSFPSGHSTCGFYFLCLYFAGRRTSSRLLQALGLGIGLGYGILLSVVRIVQGGHFISDCLFAALLMWEVAYFVDWLVFECEAVRRRLQ